MKARPFTLIVIGTVIIAGTYYFQQKKITEVTIKSNSPSHAAPHSHESSTSSTKNISTQSSEEELERIKLAIEMRKTADAVYGTNGSSTEKSQTVKIDPKIQPTKFTRVVANSDGKQFLKLLPNKDVPNLVSGTEHLKCPLYTGSSLEELKKKAESGDACSYQQYGVVASFNIKSQETDIANNREELKKKLKPILDYLIKAVLNGDALSAVELGCLYVYEPFIDKTEGLAWFMVANAMGSQKVLGTEPCTETLLGEPEQAYITATERAKFYIDYYNFKVQ